MGLLSAGLEGVLIYLHTCKMHPIILISTLAIQLLIMPSSASAFLLSPLDPRVLARVYSSPMLTSQQKERIRIFIEKVKLKTEREKNINYDFSEKVKSVNS